MRRRAIGTALAATAATVLAACGISADDAPRNIPLAQQQDLALNRGPAAGAATGSARIYLLTQTSAGEAQVLVEVARDVGDQPDPLIRSLLDGPNALELDEQLHTAIPEGTLLHSATSRGGIARVDLSGELLQLSGDALIDAVAQVVFTASQVDGVGSVELLVDGVQRQWPIGNGALRSGALTVYDFPGLLPTSQPAYPSLPAGATS